MNGSSPPPSEENRIAPEDSPVARFGQGTPVIGVTGLPCSGKSLAAEFLAEGKVPGLRAGRLFKADDVGHEVLERPDVKALLRGHFGIKAARASRERAIESGKACALKDGGDESLVPLALPDDPAAFRRAIAELVFSNPENLAWLEGVIHPLVVTETDARLREERGKRPVIVEAALLFAADMDTRCDRILLIETDFAVRLGRAAKRGWSPEELRRRENRQVPLFTAARNEDTEKKIRVVQNDGDVEALIQALSAALA